MPTIEIPGIEHNDAQGSSTASNVPFLNEVLGTPKKIHFLSRNQLVVVDSFRGMGRRRSYDDPDMPYPVSSVSQLFQATHQAFAAHVPLSLSPEVIWYAICHELAICIKANPKQYARFFTDSPDKKKEILVRDDSLVYGSLDNDWLGSINLVRDPLRENISEETLNLFLPKFSTLTPESETAILVAFMDSISSYYEFKWMTMCGIPSVLLEGEVADWELLVRSTVTLSEIFTELKGYFNDLLSVLREVVRTVKGEGMSREFWNSIYKYNGGSGGPYVTGWITALTAYLNTLDGPVLKSEFNWKSLVGGWGGYGTNDFPSHVSKVNFVWNYFGRKIPMSFVTGVLGTEWEGNGFLTPKLGVGVIERATV